MGTTVPVPTVIDQVFLRMEYIVDCQLHTGNNARNNFWIGERKKLDLCTLFQRELNGRKSAEF